MRERGPRRERRTWRERRTSRRGVAIGVAAALVIAAATAYLSARRQDPIAACLEQGNAKIAACLVGRVPAETLEAAMFADPSLAAVVLPALADALAQSGPDAGQASGAPGQADAAGDRTADALAQSDANARPAQSDSLANRAGDYAAEAARARTRRLSAAGTWSDAEGEACLRLQLVDADRFVEDGAFRARVLGVLPRAFDRGALPALRDQLLYSINSMPGVDFAASEAIESAWGAIPRESLARETPYQPNTLAYPDDARGEIEASIYSFPSPFLDPANVTRFMSAVRAARPDRTLVALVDLPMHTDVADTARSSNWTLVETHGRNFSPWPRDPFTVLRRTDGGVNLLVRPNVQARRSDDNDMARELIQGVPDAIDNAWGRPTWSTSPVPFHNGLVLLTPDAAWIDLHSVGTRTLELLGVDAVSVDWLASTPAIWQRYRRAVLDAAAELAAIYKRDVHFVHDMPVSPSQSDIADIAAGGGFDLDSIFTVLPQPDGRVRVLVGDVRMGAELLARAPAADLARFTETYGLSPAPPEDLRRRLIAMQQSTRATGLARFLDRTAAHLTRTAANNVAAVERVPLFFVTVASLADAAHLQHEDFQITWNNVVLDTRDGTRRAEGFASGLATGDRIVSDAFARAGYTLDYLPVLPESVILRGGYRCASQHVRR